MNDRINGINVDNTFYGVNDLDARLSREYKRFSGGKHKRDENVHEHFVLSEEGDVHISINALILFIEDLMTPEVTDSMASIDERSHSENFLAPWVRHRNVKSNDAGVTVNNAAQAYQNATKTAVTQEQHAKKDEHGIWDENFLQKLLNDLRILKRRGDKSLEVLQDQGSFVAGLARAVERKILNV